MQHTFLHISLPLFCTTTTWNFQKHPGTSSFLVLWRKCHTCSRPLSLHFTLPLIFTLMAASISHFLTAVAKFSCCSSNKQSTRRRNDRLQRLLANKFLVFWLGGGCLRDLVEHDEFVTVYLLKTVFSKSYVEDVRKQEMAVVNLQYSWRTKQ